MPKRFPPEPAPPTVRPARDRAVLTAFTLAALAARVPGIGGQPLQWDEGWSIALARLPLGEAARMTALDVHPPLYYALLHAWIAAVGAAPFALRALSALVATAAVPLAAAAARAWLPKYGRRGEARRLAGWAAALAAALSPPLIYYAGIGRMYAPATTLVLAAVWGLGTWLGLAGTGGAGRTGGIGDTGGAAARRGHRGTLGALVAVAASAGALLSFYYSGFALAGLGLAALVARPSAWRRWAAWVGATALACAPWLAYALPLLLDRMANRAATGDGPAAALLELVVAAWRAVLFVNTGGAALAGVVAAALAAALGLAVVRGGRIEPGGRTAGEADPAFGRLLGTTLPIALVCAAVAVGASAHMFAPRYATVATPFVALGIGWAAGIDAGAGRSRRRSGRRSGQGSGGTASRWIGRWPARWSIGLAAVALLAASLPTLTGAIYARSAEWFEAYDPGAVHRAVVEIARPGDVVAFNILSQAGAYDSFRAPGDPRWTYAQLWDPVHEPAKLGIRRVETAYETALRGEAPGTAALWLALYKGTAAADSAALKAWADEEYFPVAGRWVSDTMLAGYVDAPTDREEDLAFESSFGHQIHLRQVRYTSTVPAGGNFAITLKWRPVGVPDLDLHVVVRLVDSVTYREIAVRDAVPVAESRPTTSWRPGESVEDRHGLRLPADVRGTVLIAVSLVDPLTGDRGDFGDGTVVGGFDVVER